jgi:hypothetical protein
VTFEALDDEGARFGLAKRKKKAKAEEPTG